MPDIHGLIQKLTTESPSERKEAAWELGNLGPAAAPATEVLVGLLADEEVRATAEWALARIGPPAVEALVNALWSPERSVQISAVNLLRIVAIGRGPFAPEALAGTLDDPDPEIRALAARTLGELGGAAKAATSALMRALADPEPAVRQSAALALGKVAEVELPIIERLTASVSDDDPEVRRSSVGALVSLAQRKRTRDFLMAVSRLEQLAKWGPGEDRALYRSAAAAVRVSLPVRRSWPFRSAKEATAYEVLPRPAEAPAIDTESLPRVDGE